MRTLATIFHLLASIACTMPSEKHTAPATRTVDLANGIRLEYAEQGEANGAVVVLLPGYTDPWRSYELVLEHLPPSIHAFALSQRGQGGSSHPMTGYAPADYSADLLLFMDALKIDRAVLVGHSMSSYAAQRFAIDHPERTHGLFFIGSFTTLRGDPGIITFRDSVVSQLSDPVDPAFVRGFLGNTFNRKVPGTFLDTMVALTQKVPVHVWKEAITALSVADHSSELHAITAPTVLVWGGLDPLVSRSKQDELLKAIPGSRLLVYEDCGHSPNWEDPERTAGDLVTFISRLE